MRKTLLKILIPLLLISGTTGIGFAIANDAKYSLDVTEFNPVVAFATDVDLDGLTIIKEQSGEKEEIPVTDDMVTADSTLSIGEKSLTIKYKNEKFIVNFIVKYKIEFYVDGEIYDIQYVNKISEVELPEDPQKDGYEFIGWTPEMPEVINGNYYFDAEFSNEPAEIPGLPEYTATYGDLLGTITLPSNKYGHFEFVDDLNTTVGNAGQNKFLVNFIPNNEDLNIVTKEVIINVSKKKVVFEDLKLEFKYDGGVHKPTFTLKDNKGNAISENISIEYLGDNAIDCGNYYYAYRVVNDNYEGSIKGYFKVVSEPIVITIDNQTIKLGEKLPELTYTVTYENGEIYENIDLINIQIVEPNYSNAGEYDITVKIGNKNFENVVINKGKLTVEKIELGIGLPQFLTSPVYGNELSSVVIADNYSEGYWKWKDPSISLNKAGKFEVTAIFIPYSSLNYNTKEETFEIDVLKKTLTFENVENVYIYDGNEKEITYNISGFEFDDTIDSVIVKGNKKEIIVGTYERTLVIESDNYEGTLTKTLFIRKATPSVDFSNVYEAYINTKVEAITLNKGYEWINPTQILNVAGNNQKVDAKYVPEDTHNYEEVLGKFTVNVKKLQASITAKDEYIYDYNGDIHILEEVYGSHTDSTITYKYEINGRQYENLRNAGVYTVTITLPETNVYLEATKVVTVTINTIGVNFEPITYNAVYEDTLSTIILPTSEYGVWTWKNDLNTLVGEYGDNTHIAVFTSNDSNYKDYEKEVIIKVSKKTLTITLLENTFDYNGNAHKLSYSIERNLDLVVDGDIEQTNAGHYETTLIINDKNYQGSLKAELIINTINEEITWPKLEANWNTLAFELNSQLQEGFSFDQNYTFNNVGEFEFAATYTPKDTNNYNVLHGNIIVKINKIDASIEVLDLYEFTYNGEHNNLNIMTSHRETALQFEYLLNDNKVEELVNVGEYKVIITLPESEHYKEIKCETKVIINQLEVEAIWNKQLSYIYDVNGQTLPTAVFKDVNNELISLNVVEKENKEFKNADIYSFVSSLKEEYTLNYKLINNELNNVEISKKTIDLTYTQWNSLSTYVYDGNEVEIKLINLDLPSDIIVKYEGNKATETGNYIAKVSFEYNENNYNELQEIADCHWSIVQTGVQVVWTYELTYTFNGKLIETPKAYIEGVSGRIELEVKEVNNKEFRNAGVYSFIALESTNNYALSGNKLNVEIEKAELEVIWNVNTYEYTGNVLAIPTATIVDLLGNTIILDVFEQNGKEFKNAGSYNFEAQFNESYEDLNNYNLTNVVVLDVEIEKSNYDMTNVKWDYVSEFTYDGTTHSVILTGLPEGVTAKYFTNNAIHAGKYHATCELIYDSNNYNEISVEACDWEILPQIVSVSWEKETEYVYNGLQYKIPTATYTNILDEVVKLNVLEKDKKEFINAGTYKFVANIIDSLDKNNYSLIENEITVEIKKAGVSINELNAIYGDTLGSVTLPIIEEGKWEFTDSLETLVGLPGVNTFDVRFESSNDNYESFNTTVNINVSKKELIINVTESEYTYDGNEKTLQYELLGFVGADNEETVNVLGNVKSTNICNIKSTLKLESDLYYANPVTATLVILQAETIIKDNLVNKSSDYTGEAFDIKPYFEIEQGDGILKYEITVNGIVLDIIDALTYSVRVYVEDTLNYKGTEINFEYTINKILPSLSLNVNEFIYTGNDIILDSYVSHNNTDNNHKLSYQYSMLVNDEYVSVNSIHNAGTYKVIISLNETTNFINNEIETNVIVNKGSINLDQIDAINATYGQKLGDFEFEETLDGVWSWQEGNDVLVGNVGTNAHVAVFTPTDTSIDTVYQNVTFNVSPKTINIILGTLEYVYDGLEHTISYALSETPEGVEVIGNITKVNVGNYDFTLEITGNENYYGKTTGTLKIVAAKPQYEIPTLEAIYGNTYNDIILPELENGTWTFVEDLSTSVGIVGKKNVQIKFNPSTENYYSEIVTAKLVVSKADFTPENIPTTFNAVYGNKLDDIELPNASNGTWNFKLDSNTLVGNAGSNQFVLVFTHENPNYNVYETIVTINVEKADSVITNNLGSLTYTGSELIKSGFSLNHNESSLIFIVNGDALNEVINAGEYNVLVKVEESQNYKATQLELTIVVNKANPVVDFTTVYEAYWNDKLSTIVLPNGYSWQFEETVLDTVGNEIPYAATFTPEDTDNYHVINSAFKVNVLKRVAEITVEDNQVFDFDVNNVLGFKIEATTNNTDDNTIEFVIVGPNGENKLVNAGKYVVTLKTKETDHFTYCEVSINVEIKKAKVEVNVSKNYAYGTTLENIKPESTIYGEFVVTDQNPNEVTPISVSDNLGYAGSEVTLWVIFTPYEEYANNFASFVEEITISIVKKELTFTDVVSTYVYDGKPHSVSYKLYGFVDGLTIEDITVLGNESITNVNESKDVVLTIEDDNYYGTLKVKLEVVKQSLSVDFSTVYSVNWNTKLSDIELPDNYAFVYADTLLDRIGTFEFDAVYTPEDTDNYDTVSGKFTVTVNKLVTEITVNELKDLVYSAEKTYQINPTINHRETTPVVEITFNDELVEVLKDAGTYNIKITVAETAHYNSAELEYSVTIAKQNLVADFSKVYDIEWKENLVASDVKLDANYAFVNGTTQLTNIGTILLDATFTPTDLDNYNIATGQISVNVKKAKATVTADQEYNFTYNGSAVEISNIVTSHTESQVTYGEYINAGTYTVTITLPESTHYSAATCQTVVKIAKFRVELPTNLEATYGQKLSSVQLPSSDLGTWSWKNADQVIDTRENARYLVTFTPIDTNNYAIIEDYVSITVLKDSPVINVTIPESSTYTGSSFNYLQYIEVVKGPDLAIAITKDGISVTEIKDAGTYEITIKTVINDNYEDYNETVTFVMNKVSYTNEIILPTVDKSLTYGDLLSNITLNNTDQNGTFVWKNSNQIVKQVGNNVNLSVTFKPTNTNFENKDLTITVVVNKKLLTFTNVVDTFDYNGTTQYITYNLSGLVTGDQLPNVTGNDGLLNVGSQEFTLTVESDYYYSETLTRTLTINKATPNITLPTYSDRTFYEDRIDTINLTSGATANTKGEFTYADPIYVGTDSTSTVKVIVTFTPDDLDNYEVTSGEIEITLLPVAYDNNNIYYGTVEKALNGTNISTITIIPGSNPIIRENVTINSGITLFIPYSTNCAQLGDAGTASINWVTIESGGITEAKDGSYGYVHGDKFATEVEGNLRSELIIDEGITVVNKGNIEVAGQLSGGSGGSNAAGQTSGLYSKITMKANSSLINQGNIYCYGYIDEETKDNGSTVDVESGIVYMPYVLRDFRGGTQLNAFKGGMDSHHVSGFDQYEVRNIQTKVIYRYNSKLIVWANLYAGDQHNKTSMTFIGNVSDGFIQFTDSQYSSVEAKFNKDTEVMDIKLIGGAKFNSIKLSIKASITTVTVDTKNVYSGIHYRQNISTHQAEGQTEVAVFTLTTNYKLMTGATLTINKGTKVVGEELIIYSSYAMAEGGNIARVYPANLPGGKFIVKGEVSFKKLAGKVIGENSAKISVSNESNTIHAYEGLTVSGSSFLSSMSAWQDMIEVLELQLTSTTDYVECPTGTYYHNGNGWFSEKPTITYNHNDDSNNITSTSYKVDINGLSIDQLLVPTRKGYTFEGWYYDQELTNKVTGNLYGSYTLYAKWSINNYTIQYVITKDEGVGDYTLPNDLTTSFTINSEIKVYNLKFDPYYFNGWYTDSELSNRFITINYDTLVAIANNNKEITLYAHWMNNFYIVDYIEGDNPNGIVLSDTDSFSEEDQTFTVQTGADIYDLDLNKQYYFGGWYLEETFDTLVTTINTELLIPYANSDKTIYLYAKWIKKVVVTTTVGENTPEGYTFNGVREEVKYYIPSQLSSYHIVENTPFITENTNINSSYYFAGWYVNNDKIVENKLTQNIIDTANESGSITVSGKWIQKNALNINFFGTVLTTTTVGKVYYIPYNNEYGVQVRFVVPTLENYLTGDYATYRMYDATGTATSKTLNGVTISNGEEKELTTETSIDVEVKKLVKVTMTISSAKVTITLNSGKAYDSNFSEITPGEYTKNTTIYLIEDSVYTINRVATTQYDKDHKETYTINGETLVDGSQFTVGTSDITIEAKVTGSNCVIEGTLITMADGSQKPVEQVVAGDLLLVFNHETGQFDVSPVIFNEADQLTTYTIINLEFSNGSIVKVIYEHGFFDLELMQYVYITESNYMDFVGHRFSSLEQFNGLFTAEEAVLVNAYLTQEYTRVYSPVTVHHLNYYTENMLSMPGGITGLFNMFVYSDNLQYDLELMEKDIEMYGLYTYDDFKDYIPYEVFELFPAPYLKISVAKGLITFDDILGLIDRYIGIIVDSNM